MNKETIEKIKTRIEQNTVPNTIIEYGGGGLIITNDSSWGGQFKDDAVIITEFSKKISWLIFQLQLHGAFAPSLGIIIKLYTENNCSLKSILSAMVTFHEACLLDRKTK